MVDQVGRTGDGPPDGGGRGKPNIIWITLDSVRADHTTPGGYHRDTTPALSRMAAAKQGQYLPNGFAHARYTLPSAGSMLSGAYPSRHRLGYDHGELSPEITTIAERFSRAGYFTDCVSVNDFVSNATQLNRGFERFDLLQPSSLLRIAGIKTVAKFLVGIRHHSAGLETDLHRHATGWLLTEVLKQRVRSYPDNDRPVFLYAHYNETHMPYYPPRSHIDQYTDEIAMTPAAAGETAMSVVDNLIEIIANGCDLTPAELDALIAMYDAELRYTDELVGELVDLIDTQLDETIVIVTSDHGEFFGERGLLGHKAVLDNRLLNVPIVTYGFPSIPEDALVQHTDLMATLLALVGGSTRDVDGHDLRTQTREYAVSQDGPNTFEHFHRHNPSFDTSNFPTGPSTAIQDRQFKLIAADDHMQLFELPDELTDRSEDYPSVTATMEGPLMEVHDPSGARVEERMESGSYSREMAERLTALGYATEEL